MKQIDPELLAAIEATVQATLARQSYAQQPTNLDEIVAGFKSQIDAHVRNLKLEVSDIASTIEKRCNETDDLVSRLLAQIADLEVRLRKYMDGDRYSITKRQVARLMREHNG